MTSTAQPALIMNDYLMTGSLDYLDGQTDIALDGIRNKLEYFNPDKVFVTLYGCYYAMCLINSRSPVILLQERRSAESS
ncbi:hypothetical protein RRG08_000802 [Elysia crispata]|uniref:Uncharacterized protein n=1 Tax=Elysia crispata TaxID=231223 RepID=A0AAE1CIU0_9GAST|nr:hypothetical protein RRG08_000802 [Elysia crispata]